MKVQIFDKIKNEMVEAEIVEKDSRSKLLKLAVLTVEGREVGRMLYFFGKDHVSVQMVYNDQPRRYGKVGTELFNYAFQTSVEHNKEGRIILSPVPSSIGFWEKMGFEFISTSDMRLTEKAIQVKMEDVKLNQAKQQATELGFKFKSFKP